MLAGVQVWLGSAAPSDAVDRLRRTGLPVTGVIRAGGQERALARQGPALVLWFHVVAAVLGLVLGMGGIALMASTTAATLTGCGSYAGRAWRGAMCDERAAAGGLGLVVASGLLGAAATWLAWLVTGDRLPVFVDDDGLAPPPRWPEATAVLRPCAAAMMLLAVVAMIAAVQVRRTAAREKVKPM
jgi:putative ABC transport system permease protein